MALGTTSAFADNNQNNLPVPCRIAVKSDICTNSQPHSTKDMYLCHIMGIAAITVNSEGTVVEDLVQIDDFLATEIDNKNSATRNQLRKNYEDKLKKLQTMGVCR